MSFDSEARLAHLVNLIDNGEPANTKTDDDIPIEILETAAAPLAKTAAIGAQS